MKRDPSVEGLQPTVSQPTAIDLLTVDAESPWFHAAVLVGCVAILLLAFCLRSDGHDKFYIPGTSHVLPELCTAKRLLGWTCPGCGLTRSVVHTSHGRVAEAFGMNPAGPLFFLMFLVQVPWRIWKLFQSRGSVRTQKSAPGPSFRLVRFFTGGGFALFTFVVTFAQWILRPLWSL